MHMDEIIIVNLLKQGHVGHFLPELTYYLDVSLEIEKRNKETSQWPTRLHVTLLHVFCFSHVALYCFPGKCMDGQTDRQTYEHYVWIYWAPIGQSLVGQFSSYEIGNRVNKI